MQKLPEGDPSKILTIKCAAWERQLRTMAIVEFKDEATITFFFFPLFLPDWGLILICFLIKLYVVSKNSEATLFQCASYAID